MKHDTRIKFLAAALAGLLLLGLCANFLTLGVDAADGQSSSEIKNQIAAMEEQRKENQEKIDALEQQLQDNLTEMEAIVAQKNVIDQEIHLLHVQVNTTNEMISAYNVLIADKQEELTEAETRLAELNEKNKERIRAMEEDGALSYWSVLFKANSFADLLDRLNMIEEIAAADRARLLEMQEAAEAVEAAREELVAERVNLEAVREELAAMETELQAKRQEAEGLLTQLIAIGEEYERYMAAEEEAQAQLVEEIMNAKDDLAEALASEAAVRASIEASIQASIEASKAAEDATRPTYTKPPESQKPPVSESGWAYPMDRRTWVTSAYGWRPDPFGSGKMVYHHGVDLEADYGDDILATRAGYVIQAGWSGSMGNYAKIDHGDGFSSIYMHMEYLSVSAGQYVSQGQKLGGAGTTGSSTGVHLHFGIYYNGKSVNPAQYVNLS